MKILIFGACRKTPVPHKDGLLRRLLKIEKRVFAGVSDHLPGKRNAEVGLFLQALFIFLFIGSVNVAAQLTSINSEPVERTLRYKPENNGFVIINGDKKFTRALYGTNTAFRLETSDVPEFGFFMPDMGGNLQFGIVANQKSIWLNKADFIKSIYYPGTRIYEIKDPVIGEGTIKLKVLALANADGMVMQITTSNLPGGIELFCMYGGASNKRFSRNGDLGVDKPDCFDLHTEACKGNAYTIAQNRFVLNYGQNTKQPKSIEGIFPAGSKLKISSPYKLDSPLQVWASEALNDIPVLTAKTVLKSSGELYLAFQLKGDDVFHENKLQSLFDRAEEKRIEIANTVKIETPDQYINPLGGVLSTAADAIWDSCWMHGAIGWRMPLNGWRAAYTGDCLGWHDRARMHFDNYAASQVTQVEPVIPHPAQDTLRHFARAAKIWGTPMYSNGYICRNPGQNTKMHHYDMNLCYIDELLWHLNWTGDWDYAKKIWPVIELHLKWEKRNFDPDDDGLYDAYASIWASDALYYNSGAVTHSSSYNYRANRLAALIASKIGVDPKPYSEEAEKIIAAINSKLWMPEKGCWAEYIDFLAPGNIHPDAAIWTVYHAIDSDVPDIFQAYQATRYIDTEIPHIPVIAKGLKDDNYETISTTHWFPYSWSINNVAFAEVAHTALAYWQSGRYEKAFKLFKSSVLDGMYLGSSPGNIGQISFYDKARGECYRDFGDPVGMYSRAIVQGLFGIKPDLLNNRLVIQPGFPSQWDHAKFENADITYRFKRDNGSCVYTIINRLKDNISVDLMIKAGKSRVKEVLVNGKKHSWALVESVGVPMIRITCNKLDSADINIIWEGEPFLKSDYVRQGVPGNSWQLKSVGKILEIYDPQNILTDESFSNHSLSGRLKGDVGHHTLFVQLEQGDMRWWEPINIQLKEPFEVIYPAEDDRLKFKIKNNQNVPFVGAFILNKGSYQLKKSVEIRGNETSAWFEVPHSVSLFGTNSLELIGKDDSLIFRTKLINWNVINRKASYTMVSLDAYFNASVTDIFDQAYLTPRSPYTTLQIPTQGIGEWCHPMHTAVIDDAGFRSAVKNEVYNTPFKIPFRTVADSTKPNIVFTTLWDNYPDKVEIPLTGNAGHAYLLLAGSTNHMQCHIPNGKVKITYTDGTVDALDLVNPDNWLPVEQDLYTDMYAFQLKRPNPFRVAFKTGSISRHLGEELGIDKNEVYGREIDGGAGILVDLPLNQLKNLKSLSIESTANDVVVGLMSLTLMKRDLEIVPHTQEDD
ncbi:DUF4450 domain-containing protein [Geofilum sp. OHC36d9]|uniref:DUF4450 domain-containing protein n=1 Tax=Geofilum sp. OHC36d9 TaxID=3458413 RepID=UPI0040340715